MMRQKSAMSSDFAHFLAGTRAVRMGSFKLKSGAYSDIFFDFGNICRGDELSALGSFYADAIVAFDLAGVDAIFGPAYKAIPIAAVTSMALWQRHKILIPAAFNRKSVKDHGEGGRFIGAKLETARSVLVVDDVITDGLTKYEALEMLAPFKGLEVRAFLVGLDREDTDPSGEQWVKKFVAKTGVPVMAITTGAEVLAASRTIAKGARQGVAG